MKNIIVFTDGASRGNPGPGGWGSIIQYDEKIVELGGGEKHTTNNRMELTAVIEALSYVLNKKINTSEKVNIFTDSSYVLKGSTIWIYGWKNNNWKTKSNEEVLNIDLWKKMDKLQSQISCIWKLLPGHSGIAGNERCDVIATGFADKLNPALYQGPIDKYKVDISKISKSSSTNKKKKVSSKSKAYSYVSMVNGNIQTHSTWAECEKRVKGVSNTRFKKVLSKDEEINLIKEWKNFSQK